MSEARVLVAGIGNIFLGDDGFGVEVAQELLRRPQAAGTLVVDYGIRGFDLAYAMMDEHEVVVLVDATARGEAPGTLYVIEADLDDTRGAEATPTEHAQGAFQGHLMTPAVVLEMVRTMGASPPRVLVVGCEPLDFGPEQEGRMGLSEVVTAAIPEAVAMVERLVAELLAAPVAAAVPVMVSTGTGGPA